MRNILILLLLSSSLLFSQEKRNTSLTVYNDNLSVVKESRQFFTPLGISEITINDIPDRIIPSSVLLDFDGEILEQSFRNDLSGFNSLFNQFIGKQIKLISDNDLISGELISVSSNQVLIKEDAGGYKIVPNLGEYRISFEKLPENILTRPTLIWQVKSKDKKEQNANLLYQTEGISWNAEYIATINEKENRMNLNTRVNLRNNSGADYKDANLKLIAGNINRVEANNMEMMLSSRSDAMYKSDFNEDKLFEYHSYDLDRKVTLLNNEEKRISLFNAENIKIEKEYLYKSMGNNVEASNPSVVFNFENSKDNNLGLPLPQGNIRVYKKSSSSTELLGEDLISHTPNDEELNVNVGYAFDIMVEEKVLERERLNNEIEEITYEVEIRNRKDEDIIVRVQRNLYGNWVFSTVIDSYKKIENNLIEFTMNIKANSTAKQKYKVRFNR